MDRADTSRTAVYREFAGRRRKFQLRLGEAAELEQITRSGVGEIMVRLGAHRFAVSDIRDTIRLGLEGGGATEPEATALVRRIGDGDPLAEHLQLAADILSAYVSGIAPQPGKDVAEGNTGPATSPPSTKPAAGAA